MNRIWKYKLNPDVLGDPQKIKMPKGAQIIDADFQSVPASFVTWAIVNPQQEEEERIFWLFFTGQLIPDSVIQTAKHLQTRQIGSTVFHIFYK